MIDLKQLEERSELINELSTLLLYPEERIKRENFPFILKCFPNNKIVNENLTSFFTFQENRSLQEQQEFYVETFDFNHKATLYMTYSKCEDDKERGKLLVQLKMLYASAGLELIENELSDFLPLMLEFLANGELETETDRNKIMFVLAVIEEGSFQLCTALKKSGNPYEHVIVAVRTVLKSFLN